MNTHRHTRIALACLLTGFLAEAVAAPDTTAISPVPAQTPSATQKLVPPLPAGITELKFRDFFKMPVGRLGLEVTEKLASLNGKPVRLTGYMARAEMPLNGFFVLSPLPVNLGDEDESLSDDLPPTATFVHLDPSLPGPSGYIPGIVQVIGTLELGPKDESDGHVSQVRLQLDAATSRALVAMTERIHTAKQ
jgi:hypothetical protein